VAEFLMIFLRINCPNSTPSQPTMASYERCNTPVNCEQQIAYIRCNLLLCLNINSYFCVCNVDHVGPAGIMYQNKKAISLL